MAGKTNPPETLTEPATPRLPRITRASRSGPALHPTALTADRDVLGLNLMRGCAHRCPFCSVRGSPYHGGDDELSLYDDRPDRLAAELDARKSLPRAVFVSPATDPFPPFTEVQEETARVVGALASRGVDAWLMTRGLIRPRALAALETHRGHVKVTVSLTTCDRSLQRVLEPWCASPRLRLKQIATLRRLEIPVQVALDPLIPGVTDTRSNLAAVLEAVAATGVRHVTASYVYVREGIAKNLAAALAPLGLDGEVLGEYEAGPLLTAPGMSAARYLPRARRQRGYGMLISLAAAHGITVSFSVMTNPDFAPPRAPAAVPAQRLFPLFMADKDALGSRVEHGLG
jgi:DNA repair photolyase